MASKYHNKCVIFDAESERLLEEIKKELGADSSSAALRYCIKRVFNQLQKEGV